MRSKKILQAVVLSLALMPGIAVVAQPYSNAVLGLNPVGYWPLTETTPPAAAGLYVATNAGTLGAAGNGYYETWWQTNGVSYTLTNLNSIVHLAGAIAGDGDTAMQQGQVGQYVVVPRTTNGVANAGVTLTAPFTIEMWVYPTNSVAGQLKPILEEGFNNVQVTNLGYATMLQGVAIGQYGTFIYFNTYNGAGTKSEIDTPTLAMNTWYHIVATFDGTTKRLYTNGVQVATQNPPFANGANYAPDPVSPLIVGGGNELGLSGGANTLFGGAIDEVALYHGVLSAAQVLTHFQTGTNSNRTTSYAQVIAGDGPAVYLRLDEPAFTGPGATTSPVANNYGSLGAAANGYYLPGTTPGLAGPPYAGFGAGNNSVALNGFNAGVDIGGGNLPAALNPTNNQAVTVTAWFKGNPADCVARFQTIIGHSDASWRLNLDNNAGVQFNPGNGPQLQFSGVTDELLNGTYVNDGNWHFVAGVSDGTNDYLYLDGLLAKSGAAVGTVTNGSLQDVILGGDPQYLAPQPLPAGGGGRWFDGSLAQVAFFTNALSATQIQGLYSAAGVAPNIRQQPASQALDAGTSASIPTVVAGSMPMSFQWYQNGAPATGQTAQNLTFSPVQSGNAGSYYLVATNNYGAVTSAVVQVSVFQPGTYAYAVRQFNPVAYWPLNEATPPPAGQYIATNSGTAGAAANGYYQSWYQPVTLGATNTFYATNDIQHTAGATGDGDTALVCGQATGAGQYVVFPRTTNGVANPAVTITAPFTIEAWVKTTNLTAGVRGIVTEGRNQVQGDASHAYTNDTYGINLGQYQGYFYFQAYNGQNFNNNGVPELDMKGIQSNVWYYVVVTYDGATETLYSNGVYVTSAAASYVPDPVSPLLIGTGNEPSAGGGAIEFGGAIDDVAIYNTALSQPQIQAHYAAVGANYSATVLADNPTIYLRLDEPAFNNYPSPATYPVATNYGTLGAVANGAYQPGTAPGVAGPAYPGFGTSQAVAINGFYGAVDIGGGITPPQLNPTGKQPQTVAAWFQANPADARFQEIVSRGDSSWRLALNGNNNSGGASTAPYDNHFNPGNGPELGFTNLNDVLANDFLFNDGNWHFVAGVSDGTNAYMYLDGALAKTASGVGSLAGSGLDTLIGGSPAHVTPVYNSPNLRYFDGQVAQVAYFTNALNAAQIQQIYGAAGVPLSIALEPQSATYNSGSAATLTFGVRGSLPIYQWYSTNVNTGVVTPLAGQTNANLAFNPAQLSNTGYYFAIATNVYNAVTSSVAQLTVVGPPVIAAQTPTDVQVFVGTTPTLAVTASGPPPLAYQWNLNGAAINGATNSAYSPGASVVGTNIYTCVITNGYGATTNSAISYAVITDPTAPYPVQVLADGPAAYFRLDETSGTTAYDYAGGNNGTYTNVLLGQPGYTSGNAIQSDPTETAAQFGNDQANDYAGNVPPYLNFGVPSGSNAEFTVEAWVTQYFFLHGGDCIVGLGFGGGGEQFVLDTGNTSSGALRFFVRNAAGTVSAANSTNLLEQNSNWHHVVGVCDEAGGHVNLYLDGNLVGSGAITPGSGLLGSTRPLTIGARESADNGLTNYDFQFIGEIDDVSLYNKALSAAQVEAHYVASGIAPFNVQVQPPNLTTNQGSTAILTAVAQGSSPLAYQWFDPNNNPISGQTNAALMLVNAQTNQSGTYSVTVTNIYGTASASALLTIVAGPPQITTDISPTNVTVYAEDPVSLSIVASGTQPLAYQWYLDGTAIFDATNAAYSFGALTGTNTYYCSVVNSSGGPVYSSAATVVGVPVATLNPTNYNSRLKITFAGYNRDETLTNFPVLVQLSTNLPGFAYAEFDSPAGGDLRFADAGGTRELPYEIDQWNDTNGVSSVWVQVPELAGTNDFIWAYWGSTNTVPPTYTTNGIVWVPAAFQSLPPYDVVYHLKESGFPYADSTLQFPALTGLVPTPAPGEVGTGQAFASSYLDAGVMDVGNTFTVSAWVNISPGASTIESIWASKAGGNSSGFALFVNTYQTSDQRLILETGNGNGSTPLFQTGTGAVSFGQWHFVAAAVDRSVPSAHLYIDGVEASASGQVRPDFGTNNDVNLGQLVGGGLPMNGLMDEARIQSGVESANWVWASYMTVASNSMFSAYSSVTNLVSAPVRVAIQLSGGKVILTWPQGTLQSAGEVNGTYNDILGATSPYTNTVSGAQQFYRVRVSP